jgi:hypothetical protein
MNFCVLNVEVPGNVVGLQMEQYILYLPEYKTITFS